MNYKEYLFSIFFNPDTYLKNEGHFNDAINTANSVKEQFYFKALYVQAYHETGGFTSNVFKQCRNFYGMTAPNSRHLYEDIKMFGLEKFASYTNFYLSHRDRFIWDNQSRHFSVPKSQLEVYQYFKYLVEIRHYASDPNYYNKLVNLYATKSETSEFFDYDNQEMSLSLDSKGFNPTLKNDIDSTYYPEQDTDTSNQDVNNDDIDIEHKKAKGFLYYVPFILIVGLVYYFIRKRFKKK